MLDTLTVMFERVAEGRSPFVADNNHFHHKLIRLGLFHTEAVLVIYVLQAALVTSAFILRFHSEWLLLTGYLIFSGLILAGFLITDRLGWRVKRYDLMDRVIKGRLRRLREEAILIKVSLRGVEYGIPLLLLFSCLVPARVPGYVSIFSGVFLFIVALTWYFRREWLGGALRLAPRCQTDPISPAKKW